jgi:hypothetical protein
MVAAGALMATVLATLIAVDLSKTANMVRQVSLEETYPRKQQLWVVPDNGVVTTINVRGYANECVYCFFLFLSCVCVCVCVFECVCVTTNSFKGHAKEFVVHFFFFFVMIFVDVCRYCTS